MTYLKIKLLLSIIVISTISIFQSKGQTILIDPNGDGGFENGTSFNANGWTVVNGSNTNQWFIGNAGGIITGANKAYISNDSGLTNTYTISSSGRVHFYKDITFPANETTIKLTFKWQAQGDLYSDYLLVCAMPTSQTPTANIPIPAGFSDWTTISTSYPGATIVSTPPNLSLQNTIQTQTIYLPPSFAGTTQRLVFMWSNDNLYGDSPGSSIDSISLISSLPGTIHSIASGNYSSTSTWLGGIIPTPGDNVVIGTGHNIMLDIASASVVNLELNGVINFAPNTTTLTVRGNLSIDSGAVLNVFNNNTGKKLNVAGNIINNGIVNLAKTGALLTLNGMGTQTVGGSGILDSSNIIAGVTFNNTAAQPIINWGWQNVIVSSGGIVFNGGWVSMGSANSVIAGNGSPNVITVTSGGFTDGTVKRWFGTTGIGTTISASTTPTFAAGSFPFIAGSPSTGYFPAYFHRATAALTSIGTVDITFNNLLGLNSLATPVSENGYLISRQTNATWTVATSNGYASSTNHVFALQGQGLYRSVTANARLLQNGALIGTHQAGSNLPLAERAGIPATSITGVYTIGIDSSEEMSYTIASGAWNNPAIWSNGIPSCGRAAEIKASDSVWIDGSMGAINVSYLTVSGNLTITGSSLYIGCSGNNSIAHIIGKLYVLGGVLNVDGPLKIEANATFNHSGGDINIDGNASGNIANSVPSGTPIVSIATSNIMLSGGVFTVIDPHAGTISSANNIAFSYTGSSPINNTNGWTLKFGNGASTDAGGTLATPVGFQMNNAGGKIVIDSLVIDAGLSGTNRFVTLNNGNPVGCNRIYITTNGDARISATVNVAGNLTNNGNLVTLGTLYLGTYLNSVAGVSSLTQTISGTGLFKNNVSTPTANFTNLTINNNNATGVIFANANALHSLANTGTVSTQFSLTNGLISTLNDTFVLGTNAASTGSLTLSANSGGFVSGSTFTRWWGTAIGGSTINAGSMSISSAGAYPFTNATKQNRALSLRQTVASTNGGRITVKYIDGNGLDAVVINDGGYTVDKISNAKWVVSYSGITGSPTYSAALNGEGIYAPSNFNSRLTGTTAALSGTHQAGTLFPNVQRSAITLSDLNNTWAIGVNNADTAFTTIASGNWNDSLIWSSGSVPTCNDFVTVMSGHTVTISSQNATIKGINVSAGGTLTIVDSTLTVGCTNNNASFFVNGTLNVTGGLVNVNGFVKIEANATLNHSGGLFKIDGNASGNLANSVPSGTPIVNILSSNINLTGGIFTVIDPHAGTTSAANNLAFSYTGSAAINNTNGWTLKFGDGLSTDAGGALTTPIGFLLNIAGGKIKIDSLVINAGLTGTNRFVSLNNSNSFGCNHLYITNNGDARVSVTLYVAKNLINNGTLVTTGALYLGVYLNPSVGASIFQQTISGTGAFKNSVSSPTANFANLAIYNTNATGVIFANSNTLRSGSNTGTVGGTFTLTKGLINTLNDTFVLGTSATSTGTLIFTNDSGGFISGSTLSRWWGTAVNGATITIGQVPSTALGAYPFTTTLASTTRTLWLRQTTASTTGGRISIKYIDDIGLTNTAVSDGSYITDSISKAKWILRYDGITGAPLYTAAINGVGIYLPSNQNSRITGTTIALSGTHQAGTLLPIAQRSAITLSDLNSSWHLGINNNDLINHTIASGNWNDTLIWSKRAIPSCTDSVIIFPGHTVIIGTASANSKNILISTGATLTLSGSNLTVGCINNNSSIIVNGVLSVTGGDLNINGSLKITEGATFNQSGGNITIDGNAGGNALNSVLLGTPLLEMRSHLINWTGGVLTIVDPHFQNSFSSYALYYNNNIASVEVSTAHTLVFGNGISTDATIGTQGFSVATRSNVGGARMNLGKVILNGTTGSIENRKVYSWYNFVVKGNFTLNGGAIFETSEILKVGENITINAGAKLAASNVRLVLGSGDATENPASTTQIISGGGTFNSTIDLVINNSSPGGVVIARPFSTRDLTLTNGIIHTTAADSFQLGSVSGGSNTAYIDGPCYRIFAASRNATGLYNNTTKIPLGKNGNYLPIWVDPNINPLGGITLKCEVFANTNTPSGALSFSPFAWQTSIVNGTANLMGAYLQLGDTSSALSDSSRILFSPALAGNYSVAPTANTYTFGNPKLLSTITRIPASDFNGYFAYGKLTPCSAPPTQPTSFVAFNVQGTAFDASFTAATDTPDQYLVLRCYSGSPITVPVNGTNYFTSSAFGSSTVASKTGTTFTQSGLTLNTAYDYYIYSFNNSECHGPIYNTTAPLFATVTTCATAIAAPTGITGVNIHINSFAVKWNRSSIPGATYRFDVSTTSDFSNYLSGFQAVATSDTFATITGTTAYTVYYVRVRTISTNCTSSFSSALSVLTLCNPTNIPYTLDFESSLVCNKSERFGSPNSWGVSNTPGFGFTSKTLRYNFNNSYAANAWYYTQALNLTAGVLYRISFKYGTNNNSTVQKLALVYGGAPAAAAMGDTVTILPFINNTSSQTFVTDFTPDTSGIYFIGINCFSPKSTNASLFIDDIKVDSSPITCRAPEDAYINGVTTDSAVLNWTPPAPSPVGGYLYYVQSNRYGPYPNNETIATGSIPGSDSSFVLTGLLPGKKYYVWMRSVCGGDSSAWTTMPASFTTSCGLVTSFPWVEDFEDANIPALPSCMSVINANNDADSFEILTSYTGGWQAYNNQASLFTLGNGGANNDYLVLPPIALTGNQQLRYSIRSIAYSKENNYQIVLSTTGKNPTDFNTIIKPLTIASSSALAWDTDSVNLAHYNDTVYIAFQVPPGSLDGYYLLIDNITVENLPACVAPYGLTTSSISPTSYSAEWQEAFPTPSNGYQWEVRGSGTPGSGPTGLIHTDSTTSDSMYINGLISDSLYTLYVRSNCGGEYSTWATLPFKTLCGSVNIPYTQNFESAVIPNVFRCDRIENAGMGNNWVTLNNPGSGFTTKTLKYGTNSSNAANAWYYTQGLNLTAGVAYRLKFRYGATNFSYTENLIVKYDTNATRFMNDTLVVFNGINGSSARLSTKDFVPSVSGVYYIGFNCFSNANQSNLYIDDIIVELSPCLPPTGTTVSGITTNTATFNWSASLSSPGNGYEWEVRTNGNAGSGTTGLVASGLNPTDTLTLTVNTLSPNTKYTFYTRSNCGTESSPWDSSVFRTNCVVASVPFLQDFESVTIPNISTCDRIEGSRWQTANNPNYMFVNNTLVCSPWINAPANGWYYTQGINLTSGFKYRLTFKYGGSEHFGFVDTKFAVKYGTSTTPAAMQETLFLLTSTYPYLGTRNGSVDFEPTASGLYYIGLNCFTDANKSDLYIDNIAVELSPVMAPHNISISGITTNAATLSWSPSIMAPSTGYEWEIRTNGNAGSGPIGLSVSGLDSLNALTATINVLTPITRYTVYVRSRYGDEISSWDSALFITTCLATHNIPYSQDFESADEPAIPPCTTSENIGNSNGWSTTNQFYSFLSKALLCNSSMNSSNAWFYTQGLNLNAGTTYRLKFKSHQNGTNTIGKLAVKYGSTATHTSMTNTLAILSSIADHHPLDTSPMRTYTIDFSPTASGVYFIGFNCFSSIYTYYLHIDDITVELAPCKPPSSIIMSTISQDSAVIQWAVSPSNPSSGYEWEVRTSGNPGSGSTGLTASGTSTTLSATASGLISGTQYKVYVRSNCGSSVFSPWDSLSNPLPVKLVSFTGKVKGNNVILNWTTASEINNKGFVIERSVDGKVFTKFGFVNGNGNSNKVLNYTYEDDNAFVKASSKILYYRLRQQDVDGKETVSSIVKVAEENNQLLSNLKVHPNPFNNEVNILFESITKSNYTIVITDIQGRLVNTTDIEIHEGANAITLTNLIDLKAGIYIVKLIGSEQHTIKLVKSN